jgi:hypothetical protein
VVHSNAFETGLFIKGKERKKSASYLIHKDFSDRVFFPVLLYKYPDENKLT